MSDPEPTPQQDAQIRRLLAEARHDERTPEDVATRLDRVLVGLSQETPTVLSPSLAPVVDLAARRRRRVAGLLVAAAVVVIAGVTIGRVAGVQHTDTAGRDSAPSASAQNDVGSNGAQDDGDASEPPSSVAPSEPVPDASQEPTPTPTLSSEHFGRDAARLRDRALEDGRAMPNGADFVCEPADWGPGRLVPVRVKGMPAVLAYRPPNGDSQVVDLLQCGSGDIVRSTTLPLN